MSTELVEKKQKKIVKKPRKKKIPKVSKFFGEGFLDKFISSARLVSSYYSPIPLMSWREDLEVVPFYSVNFLTGQSYEFSLIYGHDFRTVSNGFRKPSLANKLVEPKYREKLKGMKKPMTSAFLDKIIERGLYFMLVNLPLSEMFNKDIPESIDRLKSYKITFMKYYDNYIAKQVPAEVSVCSSNFASLSSIIQVTKSVNTPACIYKGYNTNYTTDMFYLSELERIQNQTLQRPYYCLFIKKGYVQYVRACIANNISVNPSVLELWVDKTFQPDKSTAYSSTEVIALKTYFNKEIKTPFEESGVEIKYFESLKDAIYNIKFAPKFKSIPEQNKFRDEIVEGFVKSERKRLGIVDKKEMDSFVDELMTGEPVAKAQAKRKFEPVEVQEADDALTRAIEELQFTRAVTTSESPV